jgi:hypothetical protein
MPILPGEVTVPARVSAIPGAALNLVSGTFDSAFADEPVIPFAGLAKAQLAVQPAVLLGADFMGAVDCVFTHEPFPPFAAIAKI